MKVLVVSDSHGNYRNFSSILLNNKDADYIIHLGDGESDLFDLQAEDVALANRVIYIGGNCDFGLHERSRVITLGGARIFLAHGDAYYVKRSKIFIADEARKENCIAAFFGHTHQKYYGTVDGVLLINPGSCDMQSDGSAPSYAVVTINNGDISAEFIDI